MTSSTPPNNELVARSATPDGRSAASAPQNRPGPSPRSVGTQSAASSPAADTKHGTPAPANSPATVPESRSPTVKAAAPDATPNIMTSTADERAEILKRIAAFRNLQIKLRQDREKYYDQTLARTRSLLSQPMKPRR
ncbi:hypothetical protein RPB_1382 [Rhodopseudomonas palustris HaA2]|uniref:Uncharacterized protein n=1 Tax=Rhodopseudomonas palustris (strain HaA2) TaxID=316058 RepID=Q2J0B8_RHOP2|nr:hypothetical protein RPB_1382 [Rhodopseudomonas palustris HaA2]